MTVRYTNVMTEFTIRKTTRSISYPVWSVVSVKLIVVFSTKEDASKIWNFLMRRENLLMVKYMK